MTSNEATETAQAPETKAARATKKAPAGARRANVAPVKGKPGTKASPTKKAPHAAQKAPKAAKKTEGARDGSKAAKILDLLKRPGGATSTELQKASGWQPHSVRGFLSGTIRKKMALTVKSTRGDDGERRYEVKG